MIVRATIAKLIDEVRSAKALGATRPPAVESSPNESKLLNALAEQYSCVDVDAGDRQEIVLALAETGDTSIVPTSLLLWKTQTLRQDGSPLVVWRGKANMALTP